MRLILLVLSFLLSGSLSGLITMLFEFIIAIPNLIPQDYERIITELNKYDIRPYKMPNSVGKNYLIEYPLDRVSANANQVLQELIEEVMKALIAHTERSHELSTNLHRPYELV